MPPRANSRVLHCSGPVAGRVGQGRQVGRVFARWFVVVVACLGAVGAVARSAKRQWLRRRRWHSSTAIRSRTSRRGRSASSSPPRWGGNTAHTPFLGSRLVTSSAGCRPTSRRTTRRSSRSRPPGTTADRACSTRMVRSCCRDRLRTTTSTRPTSTPSSRRRRRAGRRSCSSPRRRWLDPTWNTRVTQLSVHRRRNSRRGTKASASRTWHATRWPVPEASTSPRRPASRRNWPRRGAAGQASARSTSERSLALKPGSTCVRTVSGPRTPTECTTGYSSGELRFGKAFANTTASPPKPVLP